MVGFFFSCSICHRNNKPTGETKGVEQRKELNTFMSFNRNFLSASVIYVENQVEGGLEHDCICLTVKLNIWQTNKFPFKPHNNRKPDETQLGCNSFLRCG